MSFQNVTFKFMQLDSFKDRYFRNNCTNGIRSIRCFPKCSEPHSENGFCGLAAVIEMSTVKKNGDSDFLSKALVVAEFKTADSPYTITSNVTGEYLTTNCKTKANPFAPFYFGRTMEKVECQLSKHTVLQSIQVNFNSDCKIFHYPWIGDRFTCKNINHVFAITVLMPSNENDTFVPVHHLSSTAFKISSDKNDNPSDMPRYCKIRKMSASNIFDDIHPSEVTPEMTEGSTLPSSANVNFCSPQRKKAPSITERLRNEAIGSVSPSNKRPKIFTAQNCLTKIFKLEESPSSDQLDIFPSLSSSLDSFDTLPLTVPLSQDPAPTPTPEITVSIIKKDINKVILKRDSNILAKAKFTKEIINNPLKSCHPNESTNITVMSAASTISLPQISEDSSTLPQSSTDLSTFIANAQQLFHIKNAALKSTESEASYIRRLNSFVEKSARSFLNMNNNNGSSTSDTTSSLSSENHVDKMPQKNRYKAQKGINNQKQDKKNSKRKSFKITSTTSVSTTAMKSIDISSSLSHICSEVTNQLMIKYFEYASPYVIVDHDITRQEFKSHLDVAVNCFNISHAQLKVPKYAVTYRSELYRYLTGIIPQFFLQRFPSDDSFSYDKMITTTTSNNSSNKRYSSSNSLIISDATSSTSYTPSIPPATLPGSSISGNIQEELMDDNLSVLSSFIELDDFIMNDHQLLTTISQEEEDGLHVTLSFDFDDEDDVDDVDNATTTTNQSVSTTVIKDQDQEEENFPRQLTPYPENDIVNYSQTINSIDCTFNESLKNIVCDDSQFFDSSKMSLDWEFYMQDVDQF